tara:strand:+ start:9318 stop:11180 length:1863 start_codon:yes stop_codon:yes gene_type:complete
MTAPDITKEILSDIIVHMKYAKYQANLKRRENWFELVTRNMKMHIKKYPELSVEIQEAYQLVYDKKIVPSMRALQFSGKPIEVNPARQYNCSFLPIDHPDAFSETMFLLLGGVGVGLSVQRHHVEKLPPVRTRLTRKRRFLVGDSIEGWADAIKVLMTSFFRGSSKVLFDYSDIRAKGSELVTSGGKAPGPRPLRECIVKIEGILGEKENGENLTTIECHDIICHIADSVLAGGIRRSALLSLFTLDDEEMLSCKTGSWFETNPQRARANNSVVLHRPRTTKKDFMRVWERVKKSGCGEPGFSFTDNIEYGFNPCHEISLRPTSFCNLTEVNVSDLTSQEDYETRCRAASFIGTIQASYTDFHYLRPVWQRNTEKDALIGVSMTGIASGTVMDLDMSAAAVIVDEENQRVSKILGINSAARLTTTKPSGSSSLVLGVSSGVHAWHSEHYIRRIRVGKNEAIYKYLERNHPSMIEDEYFRPHDTAIISVPQAAPVGATTRQETAIDFLDRVKRVNTEWVSPGHKRGANKNNVSATVTLKDDEWEEAGEWLWANRNLYSGISVLPEDGGSYTQAPFEKITEEKYNMLIGELTRINLDNVYEESDNTDLKGSAACGGGQCEIF